jgi:hypothetical protein
MGSPPHRHINNQSCCCLGSAFEVAAFRGWVLTGAGLGCFFRSCVCDGYTQGPYALLLALMAAGLAISLLLLRETLFTHVHAVRASVT